METLAFSVCVGHLVALRGGGCLMPHWFYALFKRSILTVSLKKQADAQPHHLGICLSSGASCPSQSMAGPKSDGRSRPLFNPSAVP